MAIAADATTDILQQRAEALAKTLESEQEALSSLLQVVELKLLDEHYVIETQYVQEVAYFKDYTPFPGLGTALLGVVNVRGKIFSLVDLKNIFGLEQDHANHPNIMILLSHSKLQIGFPVDSVLGIRNLPRTDFQASLEKLGPKKFEYIKGITVQGLALLNVDKIFSEYGRC